MRNRAAVAMFTAALAAAAAAPASAQSLGMTPADVRASFKPGQIIQFDLSVSNDGDAPVALRTSVMDLWYNPQTNEKIFGAPGTLPHSAANWVTFVPPTFTAPPHGTGKVHVTVTPPPDAAGGSYAVLFVESKPERTLRSEDGRAMYANLRLGALLLLTAAGTENDVLDVVDAQLTAPSATANFELRLDLANRGNAHLFPQPRVAILDGSKQIVAKAEGEAKRLFPGQQDRTAVTWAGRLPDGDYTAVLTLIYGANKVITREIPLHVGLTGAR